MPSFGEILRECRNTAQKTLQQTADLLGISAVYVSEVERGNRPPFSRERLERLAHFFNVDPITLIKAALQHKGLLEVDLTGATETQLQVLSGLARGGHSEEFWQEVQQKMDSEKGINSKGIDSGEPDEG